MRTAYRIHTSAPIERAFTRDKSWQTPGRREFVHGRVKPLDYQREPTWWRVVSFVVMAVCTLYAASLWADDFSRANAPHRASQSLGTAKSSFSAAVAVRSLSQGEVK